MSQQNDTQEPTFKVFIDPEALVGLYVPEEQRVGALSALMNWHQQEIAEARKDQIIKDFLQYSLCTSVDEELLIEIKESQLEALRTKAPSREEK